LICTQFYEGQGLGNQLWAYVTLRVIAEQKSLPFGVVNPQYFKGFPFLDLDFGAFVELPPESDPNDTSTLPLGIEYIFYENQEFDQQSGLHITDTDLDLEKILDSTKIEGNFQNHNFIKNHKAQISSWLKTNVDTSEPDNAEDICVINFRGGEYRHWKSVFLDKHYWHRARKLMRDAVPDVKFKVVTDDPKLARYYFPGDEIVDEGIASDYLSIQGAKYLILSNSSFAWFPAWLNSRVKLCIAPKFWAGYRLSNFWSCGYTINYDWVYLDSFGKIWNLEYAQISMQLRGLITAKYGFDSIPSHNRRNSKLIEIRNLRWLPRRRRARSGIWALIILRKFAGAKVLDKFFNIKTSLRMKTNYSSLQYPYFTFRRNELDSQSIMDCTYFMDEFDILQLRLEILYDVVDKFVILEARQTFSGFEKPAHLTDNLHRFERYLDKIQVIVLDNSWFTRSDFYSAFFDSEIDSNLRSICAKTLTSANVPPGESPWLREFFNKEYMFLAIKDLDQNSRIVVSDVDEVWNPKRMPTSFPRKGVFVYKQLPFVYYMNNLSNESWRNWTGSVTAAFSTFTRYGINNLRTHHRIPRRVIRSGGWHFSYQGGSDLIISKLESAAHQEFNTHEKRTLVKENQQALRDIRFVKAKFRVSEKRLPPEALVMKIRLPKWFL
jgi:hypothetical protein